MATYKTIEDVFSVSCGNYDSKHINNTSNKPMPQELIEKINEGHVTTEVLDEFIKKGYDIYRYRTQVTIHGLFNAELQKYVNGYSSMVVNQNGSLGVRWVAIDADKKNKIFGYLREVGWYTHSDSQMHYAYKIKQIISKDDPIITEYRAEAERINKDLFIGNCGVRFVKDLFYVYVQLFLCIDSVYDKNIVPIIENVSGLSFSEIEQKRNDRIAKVKADEERRRKEYEELSKKQKEEDEKVIAELKVKKEQRIQELLSDGYVQGEYKNLQKGDKLRTLTIRRKYSYSRDIELFDIEWTVKMIRGGNVRIKSEGHDDQWLIEKTVFYVKQSTPQQQKIELPSGDYKLIDYSEKAIAVTGDTKLIKSKLMKLGGRFNPKLSCGAGWVFPKSKEVELKKAIGL